MSYNLELINAAIHGARVTRKICRAIADKYARLSPGIIPDSAIQAIYSRRKLYNYLEALDLDHGVIVGIFHDHGLAVPRDRSLKHRADPLPELKPDWLNKCNKLANDVDISDIDY